MRPCCLLRTFVEDHRAAACLAGPDACSAVCSYYPLYPAAPGVMLDTSHAAHLRMPCTPDVLLLPSDLAPGARNTPASADVLPPTSAAVDPAARNVLCINPGRTVKGTAGGTCALLQLCRAEEAGARVSQRSRVETLKLS